MNIKWLSIAVGILLLLAIPSWWPYGYYTLLRWSVSVVSVVLAYKFYEQKSSSWPWVFGALAILFNPIAPIYLDKGSWIGIDLIAAIILFYSTSILDDKNS